MGPTPTKVSVRFRHGPHAGQKVNGLNADLKQDKTLNEHVTCLVVRAPERLGDNTRGHRPRADLSFSQVRSDSIEIHIKL